MTGKKIVVGLSGGVDSSVAAALLIEQGYQVEAVYLECYNEPGCRTDQDKTDALKVALQLGIRFQTLDFRKEYKEKVIGYFYREYEAGRTPNPDVMCNREIKFGIFYDYAIKNGYDFIATGHYCRIAGDKLQRARDESKDQSYFLWQIPHDNLKHILFPLAEILKSEVRVKAKELKLPTASKRDSMGICFIGDVDVSKLLRERLGENPGDVVIRASHVSPLQDVVIGQHNGLWFYTIGQRGGWEMEAKFQTPDMEPLYVIGKDREKNQLIVGSRAETMTKQIRIMNYELRIMRKAIEDLVEAKKLFVRIRNLGDLHVIHKAIIQDSVFKIQIADQIFGVAEGQSAVFYDSEGVLVGGGIIC